MGTIFIVVCGLKKDVGRISKFAGKKRAKHLLKMYWGKGTTIKIVVPNICYDFYRRQVIFFHLSVLSIYLLLKSR
jgi:hypothetical protein